MTPPRPKYIGDNICSERVWLNASLGERALFVARSQERLKVREVGRNWGPLVRLYLKAAGLVSPAAWCAAFVTYCLREAGADRKKLPRYPASTWWWWNWANATGRNRDIPKRGRLFVWNNDPGGHIGFCLDGSANFPTIEGNTNKAGSREGDGVYERRRQVSYLKGQQRWCFIDVEGLE